MKKFSRRYMTLCSSGVYSLKNKDREHELYEHMQQQIHMIGVTKTGLLYEIKMPEGTLLLSEYLRDEFLKLFGKYKADEKAEMTADSDNKLGRDLGRKLSKEIESLGKVERDFSYLPKIMEKLINERADQIKQNDIKGLCVCKNTAKSMVSARLQNGMTSTLFCPFLVKEVDYMLNERRTQGIMPNDQDAVEAARRAHSVCGMGCISKGFIKMGDNILLLNFAANGRPGSTLDEKMIRQALVSVVGNDVWSYSGTQLRTLTESFFLDVLEIEDKSLYLYPAAWIAKSRLYYEVCGRYQRTAEYETVLRELGMDVWWGIPNFQSLFVDFNNRVNLAVKKDSEGDCYSNLILDLYWLTDGNTEKFKELAMLVAAIFIGTIKVPKGSKNLISKSKLCQNVGILVKSSNTNFVREFLDDLLAFDVTSVYYNRTASCLVRSVGCLPLEAFGNYITHHTVDYLCDKDMLSTLTCEAYDGNMVNITTLPKSGQIDSQLKELLHNNGMSYTHTILGKLEYRPGGKLIFLDDGVASLDDCAATIQLGTAIPTECCYRKLTGLEKAVLYTEFTKLGYRILRENEEEDSHSETATDWMKIFLDECTKIVPFDRQAKWSVDDSTQLRTVQAAWKRFMTMLGIRSAKPTNVDFNTDARFQVNTENADALRERDLNRGYTEDDVLNDGSKSYCVRGLVVKPLWEVEAVATRLLAQSQKGENLNIEDFAHHVYMQLNLKNFPHNCL